MRNHGNHVRKNKIEEALDLLNEAAEDKREEVFELINDKYESLRGLFGDIVHSGEVAAQNVRKNLGKNLHAEEKKIRETASQIDKKIRRNPWKVLGGVALGSLVVGLMLSKRA